MRIFLQVQKIDKYNITSVWKERLDYPYPHHGVVFDSTYHVPHMDAVMDPWPWGTSVCATRLNENIVILRMAGMYLLGSVSWETGKSTECNQPNWAMAMSDSDRGALTLSPLALNLMRLYGNGKWLER